MKKILYGALLAGALIVSASESQAVWLGCTMDCSKDKAVEDLISYPKNQHLAKCLTKCNIGEINNYFKAIGGFLNRLPEADRDLRLKSTFVAIWNEYFEENAPKAKKVAKKSETTKNTIKNWIWDKWLKPKA